MWPPQPDSFKRWLGGSQNTIECHVPKPAFVWIELSPKVVNPDIA
jgi:hypothetical protein